MTVTRERPCRSIFRRPQGLSRKTTRTKRTNKPYSSSSSSGEINNEWAGGCRRTVDGRRFFRGEAELNWVPCGSYLEEVGLKGIDAQPLSTPPSNLASLVIGGFDMQMCMRRWFCRSSFLQTVKMKVPYSTRQFQFEKVMIVILIPMEHLTAPLCKAVSPIVRKSRRRSYLLSDSSIIGYSFLHK